MNRNYFNQPQDRLPIGRDTDDYGNTRLSDAPRVFTLRPLVLPAMAVMVVGCGLIVGLMAVAS